MPARPWLYPFSMSGGPLTGDSTGKKAATLRGPTLTADFKQMVEDYVARRFGVAARPAAE